MEKQQIRQQMKAVLSQMDRRSYEQESLEIARQLFAAKEWREAKTIGLTVSSNIEVDTWQIIKQGWNEGKRVTVPKCFPADKRMQFYEVTSFTELEKTSFGLYEPMPIPDRLADKSEIDLLVVPGLAFNKEGYRLGFGGGYYDRYLENFEGHILSLSFAQQLREDFPIERHDIPVEKLILPTEIIYCNE